MKKVILVILMVSIVLFAGCTAKPSANNLSNRPGTGKSGTTPQTPNSGQVAQGQPEGTPSGAQTNPPGTETQANTSGAGTTPSRATTGEGGSVTPPPTESGSPPKGSSQPVLVNTKTVVEITERLFIAQCNDVYLNPEDYTGKTIKLQGIYDEQTNPDTSEKYCFVIRYGPGCCGNDGVAGFEILYDGETPEPNDWVEATGEVEVIKGDLYDYIVLRVASLDVLSERGAEFVSQ